MGPDENEIETYELTSTNSHVYTYESPFKGMDMSSSSGSTYVYRPPDRPWPRPWLADEPSHLWDWKDFADYADCDHIVYEKEKPCMGWEEYTEVAKNYKDRHVKVVCKNIADLEQDRILKSLSILKTELMLKCAPIKLDRIDCKMTPTVKHNIVTACKRLTRYGKSTPFVACFDEYGRRIDDNVKLDTLHGMTIKLVDPVQYGSHYIEFEGVVRDIDLKERQ